MMDHKHEFRGFWLSRFEWGVAGTPFKSCSSPGCPSPTSPPGCSISLQPWHRELQSPSSPWSFYSFAPEGN